MKINLLRNFVKNISIVCAFTMFTYVINLKERVRSIYSHQIVMQLHQKSLYYTVKPVLNSYTREAQKVAEYQYNINIWEHFDWLLKIGWLLNRGDR